MQLVSYQKFWGMVLLGFVIVLSGCRNEKNQQPKEIPQETSSELPQELSQETLAESSYETKEAGECLEEEELPENYEEVFFYTKKIDSTVFARMKGKSYTQDCEISLEELRYVRVLHIGGDGKTYIGELVVNKSIAKDIVAIFLQLYKNHYPIEQMVLVDEYNGEDERSMEANNTSAFNDRRMTGSNAMSKHSLGLAIDVNPLYNPYVKGKVVEPASAKQYVDRSAEFPYKIDKEDLCYQLFLQHGFTWGGNWKHTKDYQHFEK